MRSSENVRKSQLVDSGTAGAHVSDRLHVCGDVEERWKVRYSVLTLTAFRSGVRRIECWGKQLLKLLVKLVVRW